MSTSPLIEEEFHRIYGTAPAVVVTAPGRVNLIGEHTDYNEGFVFPAAIDRHVCVAAAPRNDQTLSLTSTLLQASAAISLAQLRPNKEHPWTNYAGGVAYGLQKRGVALGGANVLIESDVPLGAGLSSSAALETVFAYTFRALYPFDLSALELIHLCQQAEYTFVGVHCGIMDQFISALGKKDSALFIDCRTLEHQVVPIPSHLKLVLCNTNVQRTLLSSEYNLRRTDCQVAAHKLANVLGHVRSLRYVSLDELRAHKNLLDPVVYRRAHHVVTENLRVQNSVEALRKGNYREFGVHMYKSHFSLRYDFQVSCRELDAAVDICATVPGVLGARMTGAGFGGCAICLVEEEHANDVIAALQMEYPRRTGLQPTVFVTTLEDGVSVRHIR